MAAHPLVMLRGGLEAGAAIFYLDRAVPHPFAIATAVNLSTPLVLTVLAVLILKEDVRWRRWSAVIVGFLGVLLVIQPQPGDLNAWTWLALLATPDRRLPRHHRALSCRRPCRPWSYPSRPRWWSRWPAAAGR